MTIAVNDAGDVLALADGKWQPATIAQNDAGAKLVLDDGAWKPLNIKPIDPTSPAANTFTEYGPSAQQAAPDKPAQSQVGADINAVAQGAVTGTGAVIAGAGRIAQAGQGPSSQRVLAALDLVDAGKLRDAYQGLSDSEKQELGAYRGGTADDKAAQRSELQQSIADYGKPTAVTEAGQAVQDFGKQAFPVDPALEGIQTGVGRMVGGVAPVLAASAVGGPAGLLGSMATIGSQAYDGAYQDAVSKGATHEEADNAAGKSAVAQAVTMAAPVSKLLQRVPMPLRDGLAATFINLGKNGVELGSANAIGTFANNYVASQTYDPTRPLTQGIGQAGLEGAIAGLVIPAVGGIARAGGAGGATVGDVMKAPDLDGAIDAAAKVAGEPPTDFDGLRGGTQPPAEAPKATPGEFDWGSLFGSDGNPAAPPAEPGPQSAGAAASRDMTPPDQINLSTADMKANRYQAEMGELLTPPQPNDKTIYVNGSFPTLAERSGDPETSQTENMLRQRNSGAFIGEGKRLTENNTARVTAYDDQTPSRTALDMMRDDRDAQWTADSGKILPSAKPADLTPAWDWVSEQLENPRIQENDSVRSTLEGFRDRLIDDGGELKTDPAAVWGMHDQLQNQLAKAKDPLNATSAEKYSFSELMAAKKIIDGVMNTSTDGQFQTALDNYAKASQEINAGEALESFRPKLTNSSGAIMAERFHGFVVGLAKLRGDPGIDPAMSISDDTMRTLINIDNDLKRAGLIKLGAAAGSPTNLLGALAERSGINAAHSLLDKVPAVGPLIKGGVDFMAQRRLNALTEKHLAEPEGGYTLHPSLNPDLGQSPGP